jgi:hypothetical protein
MGVHPQGKQPLSRHLVRPPRGLVVEPVHEALHDLPWSQRHVITSVAHDCPRSSAAAAGLEPAKTPVGVVALRAHRGRPGHDRAAARVAQCPRSVSHCVGQSVSLQEKPLSIRRHPPPTTGNQPPLVLAVPPSTSDIQPPTPDSRLPDSPAPRLTDPRRTSPAGSKPGRAAPGAADRPIPACERRRAGGFSPCSRSGSSGH